MDANPSNASTQGKAKLDITKLAIAEQSEFAPVTSARRDDLLEEFLDMGDAHQALLFWLTRIAPLQQSVGTDQLRHLLQREIALIDEQINNQLNQILHQERFQQLESSWRGLQLLAVAASESQNVRIRMLDISWAEASKDIERALEFDQSHLFNKIYNAEFGMPGGEPFGILLGDYYVAHRVSDRHPHDDMSTLQGLAEIAAASFAPFITSPSAAFFGLDSLSEINGTIHFEKVFQQTEYIKWRSFRDTDDARFLGLTLPRVLLRQPYTRRDTGFKGLHFKEQIDSLEDYLWGNACYALGTILIREFGQVGWFSHIRGVPRDYYGGGLVTHLTCGSFPTDAPEVAYMPLTDTVISDHLERRMSEMGFIPACQCWDTPFIAFHSNQSAQKPKEYDDRLASINAKLSSMLQHVLCASRIGHFIKVMVRDKTGSFLTPQEVERFIQNWLQKYTSGSDSGGWDLQAKYPLRESEVIVRERPDKPGCYSSVIYLRPHYQLDQMVSELKLTTELAQVRG